MAEIPGRDPSGTNDHPIAFPPFSVPLPSVNPLPACRAPRLLAICSHSDTFRLSTTRRVELLQQGQAAPPPAVAYSRPANRNSCSKA